MKRNPLYNKGFTLIELLVVVMIVIVLASVGIGMVTRNTTRAIMSEAWAGLGTIRSAERVIYNEHGVYHGPGGPDTSGYIEDDGYIAGISPGDLDGTYFSENCYYVEGSGNSLIVRCVIKTPGTVNTAPKAEDTLKVKSGAGNAYIEMNADGDTSGYGVSGSGAATEN